MERLSTDVVSELTDVCLDDIANLSGHRCYEVIKCIFDIVSSFIASVILIIPCIIIAAVIFMADPGNPFYVQERVGKDGKTIKMIKFRSMIKKADDLKKSLTPEQYKQYMEEFKINDDPRLLPYGIGYILRRLSIDELPQIFYNVLIKHNMSVVGPRPILAEELELNYTPSEQQIFISVKPGVTGYWQAYGRNKVLYTDGKRQEMELSYIKNKSIRLDIKILFKTVTAVISQHGAQ